MRHGPRAGPATTGYERIRRIPTMAGSTIDVARDETGQLVVIKQAQTPDAERALAGYARQLGRLSGIEAVRELYPPVLAHAGGQLVLPYFGHGSVDAAGESDPARFTRLVGRCIDALLSVSQHATLTDPDHEFGGVAGARWFWRRELTRRYERLATALAGPHRDRATVHLAERPFETLRRWLAGDRLDALLRHAVRRPLALAAHGDFGLNNVLLAGPPAPEAGLRFIDLRGEVAWAGGTPYWDPVLDLGTLVAFHSRIEPALGVRDGVAVTGDHGRLTLPPEQVYALCEAAPAMAGWADRDPQWRLRLRLAVVIRILGSVSTQLLAAPSDPDQRARTVADLLPPAVDEVDQWLPEG